MAASFGGYARSVVAMLWKFLIWVLLLSAKFFMAGPATASDILFKNFLEVRVTGQVSREQSINSYALIIYNSEYEHEGIVDLDVAENDAKAIERLFLGLGYPEQNITTLANLGKHELEDRVLDFADSLTEEATVVIYYSGHGVSFSNDDNNYIVPSRVDPDVGGGSPSTKQRKMKRRVVSLTDAVIDVIADVEPRGLVVFYDACRNSPISVVDTTLKNISGTSSFVPAEISGTAIFYSASAGQTSLASLGPHDTSELSLFTRVLVSELSRVPTLRLRDLHPLTSAKVKSLARSEANGHVQEPELKGKLKYEEGKLEFCLATINLEGRAVCTGPGGPRPRGPKEQDSDLPPGELPDTILVSTEPSEAERALWNAVKDSQEVSSFQAYLNAYPNGAFVSAATARINSIRFREDELLWRQVRDSDDIRALQDYLEAFPDGLHLSEARTLIAFLEKDQARKRDDETWAAAKTAATAAAVQDYLDRFPEGAHVTAANRLLSRLPEDGPVTGNPKVTEAEQRLFDHAKEAGSVAMIDAFLSVYPESALRREAEQIKEALSTSPIDRRDIEAWAVAEARDTIRGYEEYLDKYPEGTNAVEARSRVSSLQAREEERYWNLMRRQDTLAAYERFLHRFPDGRFASQAHAAIQDLEDRKERAADINAWRLASSSNTQSAYRAYLSQFPTGQFRQEASSAIRQLEAQVAQTSELSDWRDTLKQNTVSAYSAHLRRYPNGQFRNEAQRAIAELNCPAVPSYLSRAEQAIRLVENYYNDMNRQNVDCALSRWLAPDADLRRNVSNMVEASSFDHRIEGSASGREIRVLAKTQVRGLGGAREYWPVRVFVVDARGQLKISQIKLWK